MRPRVIPCVTKFTSFGSPFLSLRLKKDERLPLQGFPHGAPKIEGDLLRISSSLFFFFPLLPPAQKSIRAASMRRVPRFLSFSPRDVKRSQTKPDAGSFSLFFPPPLSAIPKQQNVLKGGKKQVFAQYPSPAHGHWGKVLHLFPFSPLFMMRERAATRLPFFRGGELI